MKNEDVLLWAGFRNLQLRVRQITQKLHRTAAVFFKHRGEIKVLFITGQDFSR